MYNIYYIAEAEFAKGDAVTNRVINNIKAITNNNSSITIIGYGEIAEIDCNGIPVKNVRKGQNTIQKLFFFALRGFFVKKLLQKQRPEPDLLIFYGYSPRFLVPLFSYAKKKNIKIISDIVEWYNPSHLPLGRFGPFALDLNIGMKYFVPRCDGVIAISTFLQNYYTSKKLKTIRVPVLVDSKRLDLPDDQKDFLDKKFLNLIYAGAPGKKDLIKNVIDAVDILYKQGVKIQFHILGINSVELKNVYNTQFSPAIICHGRIQQNLVVPYLIQADFSVLVRPNERYANAGFSTKFVESLNAGLPIIANLTSDLSYYLKDGYNGFVVKDSSVNSIINVLKKVSTLDRNQIEILKKNAKVTALENFDYRLYSEKFSKFFYQILK